MAHTHTLGKTPLNEWSARRRGRYLHNRRISMPSAGFEPTVPGIEESLTTSIFESWESYVGGYLNCGIPIEDTEYLVCSLQCFRRTCCLHLQGRNGNKCKTTLSLPEDHVCLGDADCCQQHSVLMSPTKTFETIKHLWILPFEGRDEHRSKWAVYLWRHTLHY